MEIVTSGQDLRRALKAAGGAVGFVPTMGYLHDGHLSLMRAARDENPVSVASIFVNPTQFGPNEDLARYPRDPEGDAEKCRSCGVDILYMPEVSGIYAPGHATTVRVERLVDHLCGPARPGHFDGVATIVTKLFLLVQPTRAYFGEKDYQQLAVIRRVVRDLDIPVEVIGMPTIREPDGLAMSSRNVHLEPSQRAAAVAIPETLRALQARWATGERDASRLRHGLVTGLTRDGALRVDYAELVDPDTLVPIADGPIDEARGAQIAVAVFAGRTRLIDNAPIHRQTLRLSGE